MGVTALAALVIVANTGSWRLAGKVITIAHEGGHALMALGQPEAHGKREAVDGVAAMTGADASGFHSILEFRAGKRKEKEIDIEAAMQTYLEFVEVVTNEVDRRLETS